MHVYKRFPSMHDWLLHVHVYIRDFQICVTACYIIHMYFRLHVHVHVPYTVTCTVHVHVVCVTACYIIHMYNVL